MYDLRGRVEKPVFFVIIGLYLFIFRNFVANINLYLNSIMASDLLKVEEDIVRMLKTVFDPEIPVNIYDLGLIYDVEVSDDMNVKVTMTLTAPNCPAADFILDDVRFKLESVQGVKNVIVDLTFEPQWHRDMMSDEAKLELGFL